MINCFFIRPQDKKRKASYSLPYLIKHGSDDLWSGKRYFLQNRQNIRKTGNVKNLFYDVVGTNDRHGTFRGV